MAGVIKKRKDDNIWGIPPALGRLRVNGAKTTPKGTTPRQQRRRRNEPTRYPKEDGK